MRDESTPYGNPWQLIWVFDGDPNTKVVCEGYSKAFKYLADLSEGLNAQVITVSGAMKGGTGEGSHMWSIVRMDDGRNYLVDVTNCDDGFVGALDQLFVAIPASGSLTDGWYGFNTSHDSVTTQITYEYREDMATLFGEGALTLSQTEYVEGAGPAHSTDLADAVVSVTADGLVYTGHELTPSVTVTIDGTAFVRGTDFDVSYTNNVNAGTATVTVAGTGNYTGTATGTFTIARARRSRLPRPRTAPTPARPRRASPPARATRYPARPRPRTPAATPRPQRPTATTAGRTAPPPRRRSSGRSQRPPHPSPSTTRARPTPARPSPTRAMSRGRARQAR